jgi:non-homologous end joining protein Ku
MGTLLRYPYEVRSEAEYFDDIQDVKVTKDMLDLAKHIVNQKAGRFEPSKFEDQYEAALVELINSKRSGKPVVKRISQRFDFGSEEAAAAALSECCRTRHQTTAPVSVLEREWPLLARSGRSYANSIE